MTKDLAGKVAVVTGSAAGIGLGVAEALAARGAHVMLTDIHAANDEKVEQARASIENACGVKAAYIKADVSNYDDMEQLMAEAAKLSEDGQTIDILVNNAGIQYKAPIDEFPVGKWDAIIAINLSGVFYGIRAAASYMKNSKDAGRIFNVASVNGHVGSPDKGAYCAAKGAVVNLSRTAEIDLRSKNIAVNCISPGFLDTAIYRKQVQDFLESADYPDVDTEEKAEQKVLEFQKIKEPIPVEAIGHIVCNMSALQKDEAMRLSGQDVLIDNGWRDNVYESRPPLMEKALIERFSEYTPGQAQQSAA